MKNLQDIKRLTGIAEQELKSINSEEYSENRNRRARKVTKQIEYYRDIVKYLETNPTTEYLHKEQARLENRMKLISDGFKNWESGQSRQFKNEAEKLSIFHKEMDMSKLRRHLKNVKFILDV